MFLLRKLTGQGLQLFSKTSLNRTSELYLRGPNNASGLWSTLMEVEREGLAFSDRNKHSTFLLYFSKDFLEASERIFLDVALLHAQTSETQSLTSVLNGSYIYIRNNTFGAFDSSVHWSAVALKFQAGIHSYRPNFKEKKKLFSCPLNYPPRGLLSVLVTSGVMLVLQR